MQVITSGFNASSNKRSQTQPAAYQVLTPIRRLRVHMFLGRKPQPALPSNRVYHPSICCSKTS